MCNTYLTVLHMTLFYYTINTNNNNINTQIHFGWGEGSLIFSIPPTSIIWTIMGCLPPIWLNVTDWIAFFHVPELNQHQSFLGAKLVFLPCFYFSSTKSSSSLKHYICMHYVICYKILIKKSWLSVLNNFTLLGQIKESSVIDYDPAPPPNFSFLLWTAGVITCMGVTEPSYAIVFCYSFVLPKRILCYWNSYCCFQKSKSRLAVFLMLFWQCLFQHLNSSL
jgi:hypothetical protein